MSTGTVADVGLEDALDSGSPVPALVLLDYDNIIQREVEADPARMRLLIQETIRSVVAIEPRISSVRIRCYGGWLESGVFTSGSSKAMRAIAGADPFPMTHPANTRLVLHGEWELATSLMSKPSIQFGHTYRVRGGAPNIRLNGSPVPERCAGDLSTCPAVMLKRFTKTPAKQCPTLDCPVTCSDAFKVAEQKMVDTMMACDLLEAGGSGLYELVVIMSADTDMLPPLVHASGSSHARLAVLTLEPAWRSHHAEILASAGIMLLPGETDYADT